MIHRLSNWLETHWVVPAFGGGVLFFFALCFFAAATNTMAGWLYALSGIMIALLGLGAFLPLRSLRQLQVDRLPIAPVTAGTDFMITLDIYNQASKAKFWLEIRDLVPLVFNSSSKTAIECIPAQGSYRWDYSLPTQQRGIYHWQDVHLRTGSPLGLFWVRRVQVAPAKGVVYPQVLPLQRCPLVDSLGDNLGQKDRLQGSRDRFSQSAAEGMTKALRDYRYGDPMRLIHWRTSARFDQFKVREFETMTQRQAIAICLDSGIAWSRDRFEAAVIIAASFYFYAERAQLEAKVWTAETGLLQGQRVVLEALAAVEPEEDALALPPATIPLIWITTKRDRLSSLPPGSHWVLLPNTESPVTASTAASTPSQRGLVIERDRSLQTQLQTALR
jgi:uncharacterized protein (DUF58 family)